MKNKLINRDYKPICVAVIALGVLFWVLYHTIMIFIYTEVLIYENSKVMVIFDILVCFVAILYISYSLIDYIRKSK